MGGLDPEMEHKAAGMQATNQKPGTCAHATTNATLQKALYKHPMQLQPLWKAAARHITTFLMHFLPTSEKHLDNNILTSTIDVWRISARTCHTQ
jgi:hypothetical protein